MIREIQVIGITRLEALHTLLEELRRLEVDATYGNVIIIPRPYGEKVDYQASWRYR